MRLLVLGIGQLLVLTCLVMLSRNSFLACLVMLSRNSSQYCSIKLCDCYLIKLLSCL